MCMHKADKSILGIATYISVDHSFYSGCCPGSLYLAIAVHGNLGESVEAIIVPIATYLISW